jgi:hypothetical protein
MKALNMPIKAMATHCFAMLSQASSRPRKPLASIINNQQVHGVNEKITGPVLQDYRHSVTQNC